MKKDELLKEENKRYETLEEILSYYALQRSNFDPVPVSAKYVTNRIKKNISKCNIETRLLILEKILYLTNERIIEGVGTKTVFYSLDGISLDLKKSVREELKNNKKCEIKEEKRAKEIENKEEKYFKTINHLSDSFDLADRDMMISLETDVNKRLMSTTAGFSIPFARPFIDVLSRLYMGFYGKNKKSLINELESLGVKVNKNGKLTNIMNDELLKYELIALSMAYYKCKSSVKLIAPKYSESSYNKYEYNKLLADINLIGKTVAKAFYEEYGLTTKESLIKEPYDKKYEKMLQSDQIMFDELLEDSPIKRIRHDN